MKKIMHIITRLDKGGSAEDVLITCDKLNKEKYNVTLIYGKGSRQLIADYKIFFIPELVREISLFKDIIVFWKIYKIVKKERPDIVHTHSSKAGILGRWTAWLYNLSLLITHHSSLITKIVHTPHGHIFYGYYGKIKSYIFVLLERLTAKITDKLIALTEGEKNESLSYGVGKPQQWTVIHSGVEMRAAQQHSIRAEVNNRLRREFGIQENALVVGTVARLDPVKGVKYFVDAISLISHSLSLTLSDSLAFLIVGDGTERKKLEARCQKSDMRGKVIFAGMREDVLDLISIMDIYVQPSLNEGMGKTIVQAMMLEKPIIATDVQGIPDLIKNTETGLLIPPSDSKSLADAILKLVKDENVRKKLGENAKNFVNEIDKIAGGYPKFSVERMVYLLEKLYENI